MKKLINFIIFLAICYLAVLIVRGDGVVDFNEVWIEIKALWYYILLKLNLL